MEVWIQTMSGSPVCYTINNGVDVGTELPAGNVSQLLAVVRKAEALTVGVGQLQLFRTRDALEEVNVMGGVPANEVDPETNNPVPMYVRYAAPEPHSSAAAAASSLQALFSNTLLRCLAVCRRAPQRHHHDASALPAVGREVVAARAGSEEVALDGPGSTSSLWSASQIAVRGSPMGLELICRPTELWVQFTKGGKEYGVGTLCSLEGSETVILTAAHVALVGSGSNTVAALSSDDLVIVFEGVVRTRCDPDFFRMHNFWPQLDIAMVTVNRDHRTEPLVLSEGWWVGEKLEQLVGKSGKLSLLPCESDLEKWPPNSRQLAVVVRAAKVAMPIEGDDGPPRIVLLEAEQASFRHGQSGTCIKFEDKWLGVLVGPPRNYVRERDEACRWTYIVTHAGIAALAKLPHKEHRRGGQGAYSSSGASSTDVLPFAANRPNPPQLESIME